MHWAADLAKPHQDTDLGALRYVAVASLSEWVSLLDSLPLMLTEEQRATAFDLGQQFLNAYSVLHRCGIEQDVWCWGVRPKFHQLCHHIAHLERSRINVMWWSCWMEEDFMGRSAKITRKVYASLAGLDRALERYITFLHTKFVVPTNKKIDRFSAPALLSHCFSKTYGICSSTSFHSLCSQRPPGPSPTEETLGFLIRMT